MKRTFSDVNAWIAQPAFSINFSIGSRFKVPARSSRFLAGALVALVLLGSGLATAELVDGGATSEGAVPDNLSANDWQAIRTQISEHRREVAYLAEEVDDGFVAVNDAQGFEVRSHRDGRTALLLPGSRSHSIALRPLSVVYGRGLSHKRHDLTIPPRARTADGEVVTSIWGDNLREWWVNSLARLEQWFELATRPGPKLSENDPLVVSLALETSLEPSIQGSGENQFLHLRGPSTTLRFEKLRVFDADGDLVPAELQLTGDVLAYVIDDREARYPLTI